MVEIKNQNLLEQIFFAYLLEKPTMAKYVSQTYIKNDIIRGLFTIFNSYYNEYKETPTKQQLWQLVKTSGFNISMDEFKSAVSIDLNKYDKKWLDDKFEAWISTKTLDKSINAAIEYLKETKITDENYRDVILKVKTLINDRNNINLRFDAGLNFFEPEHHTQPTITEIISSGYPYFDKILGGGFLPKTLHVFMGESNIGKSIFLANFAANFVRGGINTAYISAEMSDKRALKRIGSNLLNVPMYEYDDFSKDPIKVKKRLAQIQTMQTSGVLEYLTPGALFIKEYPTSSLTVPELENYLLELQEQTGIQLKAIVIDYINIMANYRNLNSENTYMKIKHIAEDIRGMLVRNNWIGLSVTQVNATGLSNSDLNQSNISESKALIHTVDSLFGIHQTEQMYSERVYSIKAIKLRDSGEKHKRMRWNIDYDYMRLTEHPDNE